MQTRTDAQRATSRRNGARSKEPHTIMKAVQSASMTAVKMPMVEKVSGISLAAFKGLVDPRLHDVVDKKK
jgi:hypothetical protein